MKTLHLQNSFAAGLVLACGFCMAPSPASGSAPPAEARAAEAAKAFSAELRSTLGAAMAQGGPAAGVRVCHEEAPLIAERVSALYGVHLGRVGVRSRQPANRLEGWQKKLLTAWQASPPPGTPANWAPVTSMNAEGGTLRWAKAIETEAACVVCHGPSVEPGLADTIRRLYPDDPAVGFEPGSLRGLLWVEVESAGPAAPASPDSRRAIPMSPAQAATLYRQMRAHLERIEGALLALGHDDGAAAAALLAQSATGGGPVDGADFRPALPEGWSRFVKPMNVAMGQASEAAAAEDLTRTLRHLGEAVGQCNACHVTYRVETGKP